jgi:hypothetical protein
MSIFCICAYGLFTIKVAFLKTEINTFVLHDSTKTLTNSIILKIVTEAASEFPFQASLLYHRQLSEQLLESHAAI